MSRRSNVCLAAIVGVLVIPTAAGAATNEKDNNVLNRAPEVLRTQTEAPDNGIPQYLLDRAECVAVFPSVTKGAFIIGGEHGRGVATCKTSTGAMSAPAFVSIGGASVGWQFGGEQTDVVMLVMNKSGKDLLFSDSLKLGAEVSAAAGPVGRSVEAAGDPMSGAGILSWSRSRGLFAGASLDGSVISSDEDANERLYGRAIDAQTILTSNTLTVPSGARGFVDTASRLITPSSGRASNHGNALVATPQDANTRYDNTGRAGSTTGSTGNAYNTGTTGSTRYDTGTAGNTGSAYNTGTTGSSQYQGSSVSMPHTASQLPRIALVGLLALGMGLAWRFRGLFA